jgi:phosphoribosylamine--glycine ligase
VLASHGYPGRTRLGDTIAGLEAAAALSGVNVFHAGTAGREGALVTSGGRVLGVQALGVDIRAAIARAYEAVDRIRFDGMQWRRDIGRRALVRS